MAVELLLENCPPGTEENILLAPHRTLCEDKSWRLWIRQL